MQTKLRLGVIGAGTMGSVLIRLWSAAGYPVKVVARDPKKLAALVTSLNHGIQTGPLAEVIAFAEVLVLALPYPQLAEVLPAIRKPPPSFVLDITSPVHWDEHGRFRRLSPAGLSGGEAVAGQLPGSYVVKSFSNLPPGVIEIQAHQRPVRLAMPYATDHLIIQPVVEQLITDTGFDPVYIGPLHQSGDIEHFGKFYQKALSAQELKSSLDA